VERFVLEEMYFLFCFAAPISKYFTHVPAQASFFYPIYGKLVNLNSGFDICYSVDPTLGNISYIHEVLDHFLFMYEGLVDFEVIWF